MNYDLYVEELIEVVKADKSISAEWRNTAIKRFKEGRAFIHEGQHTTYRKVDGGSSDLQPLQAPQKSGTPANTFLSGAAALDMSAPKPGDFSQCNCPTGGTRRDCPVHETQS